MKPVNGNLKFKIPFAILLAVAFSWRASADGVAESLPAIRVNAGGHYLETADGKPFFWLGDTGLEGNPLFVPGRRQLLLAHAGATRIYRGATHGAGRE